MWKIRGVENAKKISIFRFTFSFQWDKQCVNNKKIKIKTKKRDALLHFKMRRVRMVVGVVEVCTRTPLCCRF